MWFLKKCRSGKSFNELCRPLVFKIPCQTSMVDNAWETSLFLGGATKLEKQIMFSVWAVGPAQRQWRVSIDLVFRKLISPAWTKEGTGRKCHSDTRNLITMFRSKILNCMLKVSWQKSAHHFKMFTASDWELFSVRLHKWLEDCYGTISGPHESRLEHLLANFSTNQHIFHLASTASPNFYPASDSRWQERHLNWPKGRHEKQPCYTAKHWQINANVGPEGPPASTEHSFRTAGDWGRQRGADSQGKGLQQAGKNHNLCLRNSLNKSKQHFTVTADISREKHLFW